MRLSLSLLATAALLTACTTAEFSPAVPMNRYVPRTPPEAIALFRSSMPDKPFEEIGAVHACCAADPNDLMKALRKQAAEAGGDALIHLDTSPQGDVMAAVIRYK